MSGEIRVLVADNHAPTRADICSLLEAHPAFSVCGTVADAPGAVAAAVKQRPDLCLLNVRMPGYGVAAAWEITARLPRTKVVMLTVSREDGDLFGALRAGASGYLLKEMEPSRLLEALEDVMGGGAAIHGPLLARVVEELRDRSPRRRRPVPSDDGKPLTSREWEVLDLLRRDLSTAEIARALSVSAATIRSHIAGILRKFGVSSRRSAVRLFEEPYPTAEEGPEVVPPEEGPPRQRR